MSTLSALWPVTQQFQNKNGSNLVGGKVYIYYQGRTALATTYHDQEGTVVNANPVLLDNNGRATVFVNTKYSYTIVVCDYYGKELFSQDITLHDIISTEIVIGSDGFEAQYGKTTYSEILEHIERKDNLTLNVNGTDYCTNYKIEKSFIEFYNTSVVNDVSTTKRYILNSNNEWTFTTDTSKKLMSSLGSINVKDDGTINIDCSKKVIISAPSLDIGTNSLEGSLSNLVYKDIVKNVNSDVPVVLFGTNKSDQIQTTSSIPNIAGMSTFFGGYDPSMGPIINYVNNNVSKLKVLMKNDVTYDSINTMFSTSPYLPILNDGTQYYYPHYAAPGYGFSWFNFTFMGKDQTMSQINYYFLSTDNTWSTKSIMIPSEGHDNTDIKTIISGQTVVATLKAELLDIEV